MIDRIIGDGETTAEVSGQHLLHGGSRANEGHISIQCFIEGVDETARKAEPYEVVFEGGINTISGTVFSNIATFKNTDDATLAIIPISQGCSYRFRAITGDFNFRVTAKA